MKNKVNDLINRLIEACGLFIGYELDENLKKVIDSIFNILSNVFDLTDSEQDQARKIAFGLFDINKHSDYLLLSRCVDYEDSNIYLMGQNYFNILEKRNNKVLKLNVNETKKLIDSLAYDGVISAVLLKAYLSYSGIICKESKKLAIHLFKEIAYSYDSFAFNILGYIDKENASKYNDVNNCYNDKLEDLIVGNNSNYSDEVNAECDLIFICHDIVKKQQTINHKLFDYLFKTNDSIELVMKNINLNLYSNKCDKKQRMGF